MLAIAAPVLRELLLLNGLLTPLELLWPARPEQPVLRRGLLTDLLYFLCTPFVLASAGTALLAALAGAFGWVTPAAWRAALAAQPWGARLVEVVLVSEIGGYLAHRLSHHARWLWRFHRIHHGTEEMGWLAAHRQHPVDALWMLAATNLPVILVGFDTTPILGGILAQRLHTALLHANLGWTFGPLGYLLAAPRFHHWHHDAEDGHGRNFAALFPWLDRLFGTYAVADGLPRRYGLCRE